MLDINIIRSDIEKVKQAVINKNEKAFRKRFGPDPGPASAKGRNRSLLYFSRGPVIFCPDPGPAKQRDETVQVFSYF